MLRAIEKKDIMFIMEVRDRSFEVCSLPCTAYRQLTGFLELGEKDW